MTITLYELCVPSYLQMLGGLSGFLQKGLAHCKESRIDPESLVEASLIADMKPLRFQVQQAARHSLGALRAVQGGQFSPGSEGEPHDNYAALIALAQTTQAALQKVTPDEINARASADVTFVAGELKMPFTALGFIQSFSLPNFYFHVTTAYDILRMKGVPLSKRDYLGTPRLKR